LPAIVSARAETHAVAIADRPGDPVEQDAFAKGFREG
jgi:hypothetical protein